jgi:hypothetical protein
MDLLKKYESILIAIKLALAIPVCLYYSGLKDELGLIDVPSYVWILALIYTILQFVNKQFNTGIPIYVSVFYYVGLLSIGLPVFLANRFEKVDWILVAKIGCWFLILSVMWQMRQFIQQKNKTS